MEIGFVNNFTECDYGEDFECVWFWPQDWPHDIEFPDGSMDYMNGEVWFKAYDTSLRENRRDTRLFEQGCLFCCIVRLRYDTTGMHCEERIAEFPARTKEEAMRLLEVAADALYGEERA